MRADSTLQTLFERLLEPYPLSSPWPKHSGELRVKTKEIPSTHNEEGPAESHGKEHGPREV